MCGDREGKRSGKLKLKREVLAKDDPRRIPNWDVPCENCGAVPTLPLTGLCGPCTFGEAETAGGNW